MTSANRRKHLLNLLTLTTFLLSVSIVSAFDKKDYLAYAEEIRQTVWTQDLPEFQSPQHTGQYKEESAVILALYDELLLNQKTRLRGLGLNIYTIKELTNNRLQRILIQINDDAALKKFSEFDYKTYDKNHIFGIGNEEMLNVLGVRIFKRDGSMHEISTDDYMTTTEGKNDKEEIQKLAVPGLEVGDILDVFFFTMEQIRMKNIDPIVYQFVKEYPVLSHRIHCEIDPKLTVQYRTLNGAPDFTVSSNEDKDIVLDVCVKDLKGKVPDLWYNVVRQSPITLLLIESKKINTFIPPSVKKGGLQANPKATEIQQDDWKYWDSFAMNYNLSWYKGASGQVKQTLKEHKGDKQEVIADELYQWLEMRTLDTRLSQQSPSQFIRVFTAMLDKAEIPYEKGMTTSQYAEPIDQLISYRNTTWFVRLLSGKIYFAPTFAMQPGEIPSQYQGQQAIVSAHHTTGPYAPITLPSNDAAKNKEDTRIHAVIDGTTLSISREVHLSGISREEPSLYIPTRQELLTSMVSDTEIIKSREDLYSTKSDKRIVNEQNIQDQKEQEEFFNKEAEMFHGEPALKTDDYKILSIGTQPSLPEFIYRIHYDMGSYVKKAGNHLILSIGQLSGLPLEIEGHDRHRTADIYRSCPKTSHREIVVDIPEGYTISEESLNQLCRQTEHESCSFVSKAEVIGQQLRVSLDIVFKHSYEPLRNWDQLLEVADAWKDFHSQQVLLRK